MCMLTVEAVGLVVARLLSLLSKAVHARGGELLGAPLLVDSDATSIHDILQVCKLCFSRLLRSSLLSFCPSFFLTGAFAHIIGNARI